MNRDYLRVTPTSAQLEPDTISTSLRSLYKLSESGSDGVLSRLNPIRTTDSLIFEFVAISEGKNEPVEFYYGADDRIDVLQQRLRTIYPSSFDIDRVEVDLVEKLIDPVAYRPEEVSKRLERGRLYDTEMVDHPINQDGMIGADGGTIHARPSLEAVTPYGVRWRGRVDRRKDWMTSLTGFSETIGSTHKGEDARSGRAPLARKNERIDALEAEIERLEEALAAGGREPGQPKDARTVDAVEDDDEAAEASVWARTKRWLGSDAT